LLHLAEVQQITLSEETATEIVARFPEIRFTSDDIVARLTRDYKLARLDHLIDPVQAREWVQEDVERARWWLIIWPGFRESTDEFIQTYRSRKTGKPTTKTRCFCNKWRSEETPQREWLLGWVRRVEGEKRAAEQKRNRQIADQTWSSLTFGLDAEARQALDRRLADAIRLRLQQAHREYVSRSDPRYEAARIWVLSQPGAEERLSAAPEPEPHPVLPPAPNPEEISPAEQKRLLLYVDEFARLLDVGEITDEDLENELATRKTLASHSAVWLAGEVRRAVMLLQEKREQDAQRLWDSLTSAQQQALEYRVRADLRSHFPGRPADPGSAEWLATRVRLINNTSVFATLLKVKVELTEQDLLTLWQITPAEEPKQLSIEDYVGAILDLVRGGQLMVGKVSDHLKTTAPHLKRGERSKIIKLVADRYLAA
jgi:hypothetical protein